MGESQKRYYRRNKAEILAKQRHRRTVVEVDKWRARRRVIVREHMAFVGAIKLERGCADCGYKAHTAALDFDHLPGTVKLSQVAAMAGRTRSLIVAEIAKCDVVCANCHRIRGVNRRRVSCV